MFDGPAGGQAAASGRSRRFNARRFPTTFAAEVKDFDLGRFVADPGRWEHSGVNSQFAAAAAQQALADAGLLDDAARRPHALRRLPRLRRGHPGLPQPDVADRPVLPRRDAARSITPAFDRGGLHDVPRRARGRAGTAHDARPPGRLFRPGRPELQLPDGLRRQQPGHRRGDRTDPPRRRRPDARRRLAQHDPSVRRHRLQPAHRPVHAQRRARRRRRGRST